MCDRCGMSISADSPTDETLNQGPPGTALWRLYEFPLGLISCNFYIHYHLYSIFAFLNESKCHILRIHFRNQIISIRYTHTESDTLVMIML